MENVALGLELKGMKKPDRGRLRRSTWIWSASKGSSTVTPTSSPEA